MENDDDKRKADHWEMVKLFALFAILGAIVCWLGHLLGVHV